MFFLQFYTAAKRKSISIALNGLAEICGLCGGIVVPDFCWRVLKHIVTELAEWWTKRKTYNIFNLVNFSSTSICLAR